MATIRVAGALIALTLLCAIAAGCTDVSMQPAATQPSTPLTSPPATSPAPNPATLDPEVGRVEKRVREVFEGRVVEIHATRVNDIVEPDDLVPSGQTLESGYRVVFRLRGVPLERRLHTRSAVELYETPGERYQEAFPSSAGLTVEQFVSVLKAYALPGRRDTFTGVLNLASEESSAFSFAGKSYPATDCFAIASSDVQDEGIYGTGVQPQHDVVYLDRATGTGKYLGQYFERDSSQ